MTFRVDDIARAIGADFAGDGSLAISHAGEPATAGPATLALAMDPRYADGLATGKARAAVLWVGADWRALGLKAAIFVTRPRAAMAGVTALFDRPPLIAPGVHPTAVVDPSAVIANDAAIGPFCVIGADCRIGKGARILGQVTIAEQVEIGDNCLIYPGVRIGSRVRIGAGFTAHYNAVIGSDGFSFVTPEPGAIEAAKSSHSTTKGAAEQAYLRIFSNASVVIGDNVEIGAVSSVDKGTVADTRIGSGTKLDNHVQVGHNVVIGADCLLCAHAAVAGSSVLGDRVVLGGQAGVADHVTLGDGVIAGGASAILSNVPAGRVVMGYPAMKMDQNIEAYKALRRLPRLLARVDALEKRVTNTPESD